MKVIKFFGLEEISEDLDFNYDAFSSCYSYVKQKHTPKFVFKQNWSTV